MEEIETDLIKIYKEKYEVGFATFEKLFNLKSEELIIVLKEIFTEYDYVLEILNNSTKVLKQLENDVPDEIKLISYKSLIINAYGINYVPEYGPQKKLIEFNKFFKIDI